MRNATWGRTVMTLLLAIGCGSSRTTAGEWPRYLGPDGTGVVESGEKVARSWPTGGPRELWKVQVGSGFGGPSIAGGKVYMLDRPDNRRDVLRVFDLKTGKSLWEQAYTTPAYKGGFPGSRGTPTVDGQRVYTVGVTGQVTCFDVAARKILWSRSLQDDFGAPLEGWGFAQSPMVLDDKLIISTPGGDSGVAALDKKTGRTIWKSPPFGEADTYTSPMLVEIAGQKQIVMWHKRELASVDPAGGKVLWRYAWRTNRPIPQPVHLGDGKFFLTIGYGSGCAMIKASKSGDRWSVDELFQDERTASKVPPALFYQGHIYTNSDETRRGLQCLDAEGNVKWETGRRPSFGLGSLIIADGVIFIVHGDNGELVMAEASPGGYKELGRAQVLGGQDIWSPLALSDGHLVLRDQGQMKCVYVGAAK